MFAITHQKIEPSKIIDLCYRLGFAAEVVVSPDADDRAIVAKLDSEHEGACSSLEKSLSLAGKDELVTKNQFFDWAETMAPQLSTTLSTFMHNLLFHGKMKHKLNFIPFELPLLDQRSDIFDGKHTPNMFALACTSPLISGLVRILASSV